MDETQASLTGIYLALSACALVSLLALVLSVVALRASHRQLDQLRGRHRRLENELAVVNSAAIGMGNRLLSMEKRVQEGAASGSAAPGSTAGAGSEQDLPYTQARQLFQMGMDVEEVAQRCGLSRAEASLLQAMQEHQS